VLRYNPTLITSCSQPRIDGACCFADVAAIQHAPNLGGARGGASGEIVEQGLCLSRSMLHADSPFMLMNGGGTCCSTVPLDAVYLLGKTSIAFRWCPHQCQALSATNCRGLFFSGLETQRTGVVCTGITKWQAPACSFLCACYSGRQHSPTAVNFQRRLHAVRLPQTGQQTAHLCRRPATPTGSTGTPALELMGDA